MARGEFITHILFYAWRQPKFGRQFQPDLLPNIGRSVGRVHFRREVTYATGIYGSNIVGYYIGANGSTFGFLYNGNTYTPLEDPLAFGDTTPSGISGANIVGSYANDSFHGFLYSGGTYTTLSYFDGLYGNAHANGISGNNIVGSFPDDSGTHGFLYNGNTHTTLDDPNSFATYEFGYLWSGADTVANGILGGAIVGTYWITSFDSVGTPHGFFYTNGNYTTLDAPNASGGTFANGIDGGNIVGYYTDSATHGFLYNGASYTTLDDPMSAGSTYALGISGGATVGYYIDSSNVAHGFIATLTTNFTFSIAVAASPAADGVVSGGGMFALGASRTVTATANSGYAFANWTQNGTVVSSSPSYSFTLNSNMNLAANFAANDTITLSASPGTGGAVSGGGSFASGSLRMVTATANVGYTFASWTLNGAVVNYSSSYNFTLSGNVNLVANFNVVATNDTINLTASPRLGGSVFGGGTFALGSLQTVTAIVNSGYTFTDWTENGSVVSSSASYSFTLNANQSLVANFVIKGSPKLTILRQIRPGPEQCASSGQRHGHGQAVARPFRTMSIIN